MKLKKILMLSLGLGLVLFTSCVREVTTGGEDKPGNSVTDYSKDINPIISSTASV
ncbi:MAG: hypothetical protein MJ162_06345 [Treponema sp.]|nr:hypothetical protein [Treponema sp.]